MHFGFGKHSAEVSLDDLRTGLALFYVAVICQIISLGFTKFSALAFYSEIFWISSVFQKSLRVALGLTLMLLAISISISIGECTPIQRFWDRQLPGRCFNEMAVMYASTAFDAVTDLMILLLPMPMLWHLRMTLNRKFLVMGAFVCGYW